MSLFELVTVYMKKLRASDRLKYTFHVTPVQIGTRVQTTNSAHCQSFAPLDSVCCVLRARVIVLSLRNLLELMTKLHSKSCCYLNLYLN